MSVENSSPPILTKGDSPSYMSSWNFGPEWTSYDLFNFLINVYICIYITILSLIATVGLCHFLDDEYRKRKIWKKIDSMRESPSPPSPIPSPSSARPPNSKSKQRR